MVYLNTCYMTSFKDFAEHTKNDYFVIFAGMIIIGFSAFSKELLAGNVSTVIKIIGILVLVYAVGLYASHIKTYFNENPNFFVNSQYAPYRQNIYAGCGLCIMLLGLLLYAVYTIFV